MNPRQIYQRLLVINVKGDAVLLPPNPPLRISIIHPYIRSCPCAILNTPNPSLGKNAHDNIVICASFFNDRKKTFLLPFSRSKHPDRFYASFMRLRFAGIHYFLRVYTDEGRQVFDDFYVDTVDA